MKAFKGRFGQKLILSPLTYFCSLYGLGGKQTGKSMDGKCMNFMHVRATAPKALIKL